jgi:DinB superfamily
MDWTTSLAEQLDWHWQAQARPRLTGLTDAEYLWEPVDGCWSIRPRDQATSTPIGVGEFVIDYAFPEPTPAPVTTIAWRLAHIIVGVLGERNARYFDGRAISYADFDYPGTADRALEVLDDCYARWNGGVRALGRAGLAARCREQGFEESSMAELVLHINREMIHHLAEIAVLRDLYVWSGPEQTDPERSDQ